MNNKFHKILKILQICGLYHFYLVKPISRPKQNLKSTFQISHAYNEEISRRSATNKKSLMLKTYSVMLMILTFLGNGVYITYTALHIYQGTEEDFNNFGNASWNIIWMALHAFNMIWWQIKSAEIGQIIVQISQLDKDYNIFVPISYNSFPHYLTSVVLGAVSISSDLIFTKISCGDDRECNFAFSFLLFVWMRNIAVDISLLLFFWMLTSVLTLSLKSAFSDFVENCDFCLGSIYDKSQMNQNVMVLEERITDIYATVDNMMVVLGWPMLVRCLYDMLSTSICLYFFVDFIRIGSIEIVNIMVVFIWRAAGILAQSSSPDEFNSQVRIFSFSMCARTVELHDIFQ